MAWEAVEEQSEVADAYEASGYLVEEEAAFELCSRLPLMQRLPPAGKRRPSSSAC